MPNLSLKPPKGFVAQYTPVNAIDSYRSKKFGKEPGSRANCFNFYDADQLPDLESIGMFPPKIKRKNKVIKAE
uniref:Predicted protein n=2 Tax=Mesangiospermae TaxID=1437183 RepID=F2DRQ2_HORVV|nr:predicted protein [Hordeum vulgare subsp. vulgare]